MLHLDDVFYIDERSSLLLSDFWRNFLEREVVQMFYSIMQDMYRPRVRNDYPLE